MATNHPPTDPDAETIGMPSDDSGKGSMPEPSKIPAMGMPSEIGRYKILGIIGSGGMGHVYEAMQEAPRRRVALKVIRAGSASEMALRRFKFETQILAKLHHPNIAQIYEAGTWKSPEGEVPFFAMEYIPGRMGLIEYAKKRDLPMRDRLELFTKVCNAVHHGHQKGVIHRDLKPDNILVDSSGEPKIIDFGVARATDADLAVTTMQTTMGQLIGTLQYMSPEQCDADPDRIDTRSDVYALGVLLFQLLSGKLPYDLRRQAIHEAVRVIKEQRPDSMATISGTLKGDVDTIALKALEKDRERRYQSAAELANDIAHFLNSEPIEARPLSISYQLQLFTKKYKRTCAAVVALIITIILGIMGTTWGMIEANRQRAIAVVQKDLADKRSEDILGISREFSTDIYDGVKKVNAAIGVRLQVLNSVLTHLGTLESTVGQTKEIRAQTAFVHGRIGMVNASTQGAHLGDHDEALNHYMTSMAIYSGLVSDGHVEYRSQIVVTHKRISSVYKLMDDEPAALESLMTAKSIIDEIYEENKDELNTIRLYTLIHQGVADLLYKQDKIDEASEEYNNLIEIVRASVMQWPTDLTVKRDLTGLLSRVAMIYVRGDDFESGLFHYRQAVPLWEELAIAEPTNGRAKRDLGYAHYYVGITLVEMDNFDEGMSELAQGFDIILTRCVEYPDVADSRDDVSTYLESFVDYRKHVGQQGEAVKDCRQALLVLQPVVETNPDNLALDNLYQHIQLMLSNLQKVATTAQETPQ